MKKVLQLNLSPKEAYDEIILRQVAAKKTGWDVEDESFSVRTVKRSIDARRKNVRINITAEVFVNEIPAPLIRKNKDYPKVCQAEPIIIIGAGPAGLFAALRAIELGVKPIVLERGKDVRSRRRDIAAINKDHVVNPESNYCFGEGGAGTYSDGKLYTRSKKRGDIRRIMEILVSHGAKEDILVDAHPHIGTNKLPLLVESLRQSILDAGGEVHFNKKVTDFVLENDEIKRVITQEGEHWNGIGVILATGHSARDIFHLLRKKNILIEAKPFALGVRIEHDQTHIDRIQYHCKTDRGPYLPPSTYSLVQQTSFNGTQRGVFSFCMCPGGFIVPAATSPEEVVVNGMSPSRRDGKFANSGMVVAVELEDLHAYKSYGPLAAMAFQQEIEKAAWHSGGETQAAPAQRLVDFVEKRDSNTLLQTSYQPGLKSTKMEMVLPDFIAERLRQALPLFDKKMRGYYTNEAQIIGVESRSSSPVRIPRDKDSLEHLQIKRLFPCGEGAGYAGGIVSAAMDGERCAEMLVAKYFKSPSKKAFS